MLNLLDNRLWIFFTQFPMSNIHIRELARVLSLSPTTISSLLRVLTKKNLLKSKSEGKNLIVSANYENERFIYYKRWTNLVLLLDSGIMEEITKQKPNSVILFGSYSKGEDTEKSDIDIAVDIKIELDSAKYEETLKRKIQFHILDKKTNPNLIENIKQGIILGGIMP